MPTQPKYRIQAVADMTGIPTGTLRAWERRYGLPQPRRSDNRYRLYTDDDIAAVRAMSRMCADGLAPSEAARVVRARLERGELPEETPPTSPAWTARESTEDEWALVAKSIVDAASSFDVARLDAAVRRALVMGPAFEIFDRAFAPALRTLGEQWAEGVTGVGEEHLASETIVAALRGLVSLAQPIEARGRLLLACVADETHELPLEGVALLATQQGWRTSCLGARTPPEALAAAVRGLRPAAVGLSVSLVGSAAREGLFEAYAQACGRVPWIVGGAAAEVLRGRIEAAGGRVASDLDALRPFLGEIESNAV